MARKIHEKLISRLTQGDLLPLLNLIKANTENLRLEVRQSGKAFVYYRKCKILEIGLDIYRIDGRYFENQKMPDDLKNNIINNPEQYFKVTITAVDKWLSKHNKEEFKTQQNIARDNQTKTDKYLILDMEYNFSQSNVESQKRIKRAGFDLLGIERESGKIVLFEVKKGLKALQGKAGIKSHIKDFEECLFGINKHLNREKLISDVSNIISDKVKLGLIENVDVPLKLSVDDIELLFIYEPVDGKLDRYDSIFMEEYRKSGSFRAYRTIPISKGNFKLT